MMSVIVWMLFYICKMSIHPIVLFFFYTVSHECLFVNSFFFHQSVYLTLSRLSRLNCDFSFGNWPVKRNIPVNENKFVVVVSNMCFRHSQPNRSRTVTHREVNLMFIQAKYHLQIYTHFLLLDYFGDVLPPINLHHQENLSFMEQICFRFSKIFHSLLWQKLNTLGFWFAAEAGIRLRLREQASLLNLH